MNFSSKTILITGASKGIGRSIALHFAKEGANIVVNYNSSEKKALSLAEEIKKIGTKVLLIKADVSQPALVLEMVDKIIDTFGSIDILVNNAGMYEVSSFEDMKDEMWDRMIDVNLKGVFNCIKAVYPHMKNNQSGKIVNISSIVAFAGSLSSAVYGVSKAGITNLTKTLSKEFGPHGITINSVAPDILKNLDPKIVDKLSKETPLGRVAQPEDIARVVLFFASKDSDFVTGQTLIVDGGRL